MSLEQAEIGFIGLGAMGGGIARRLAQAGIKLHLYDVDPTKTAAFAKWNVVVHPSPKSVADSAEVVFACLPDSEVSKAVAFGAMAERLARQNIGSLWTFSGFLATPRNGKNAVLHIQDIQQN